jgi:hypothetical protein
LEVLAFTLQLSSDGNKRAARYKTSDDLKTVDQSKNEEESHCNSNSKVLQKNDQDKDGNEEDRIQEAYKEVQ